MRLEQLRKADLNLLVTFAAIAEERSISRAATRLLLSQPAVSRALQRARILLGDDLLVRSPDGFALTVRGREIVEELETLLPRFDGLVSRKEFDPRTESARFRLAGPDNACAVVVPALCRRYANGEYKVHFEFQPWRSGILELVERGQLDLIFQIDDGLLPSHFQSEVLYREDWVCAVARESSYGERMTLAEYRSANHLAVGTYEGVQTIPDKQMAALGIRRRSAMRVPYFGVALECVPGTDLVLTATAGLASRIREHAGLRLVQPPAELRGFHFLIAWHARLSGDPAHKWLRKAVQEAAGDATNPRGGTSL
jgi:DNA-binding transcriptional LysR family regulator